MLKKPGRGLVKFGRRLRAAAWVATGLLAQAAWPQAVTQYDEDDQLMRGRMEPVAHGPKLFGDEVSLYTGALSFTQEDVSLPGNNALRVAMGRRMSTGATRLPRGQFLDWEWDIPHIKGVFSSAGWRVDAYPVEERVRRCTHFGNEQPPVTLPGGRIHDPGFAVVDMYVPGVGSQELLRRNPAWTAAPPSINGAADWPVVTKQAWVLKCLPSLAGGSDAVGEGFLAVSPDGISYRFDWSANRDAREVALPAGGGGGGMRAGPQTAQAYEPGAGAPGTGQARGNPSTDVAVWGSPAARTEAWLLPTEVSDRFGNWVRYIWQSDKPWKLLRIESSDGRTLTLGYGGAGSDEVVSSVSDGTRTWQYQYTNGQLSAVLLPDQSAWRFSGDSLQARPQESSTQYPACGTESSGGGLVRTRLFEHPAGAKGSFTLAYRRHARSYVQCTGSGNRVDAVSFGAMSLVNKTITGPGLPTMAWLYDWPQPQGGLMPCTGCPTSKAVLVTDPSGAVERHVFGIRWRDNEGLLLQLDEGWNGSTALRSTTYQWRADGAGPYLPDYGWSYNTRGDGWAGTRHRPQELKQVTQQGTLFTWQAGEFDDWARARLVIKTGPSGVKSERSEYTDNAQHWVLGQVLRVTDASSGLEIAKHQYDAQKAMRTHSWQFGWPTGHWQYNADGTVAAALDPLGRATTYSNYMRGLAQLIVHPDQTSDSAVVENRGLITERTNAAGFKTQYQYTVAGRLLRVTYPTGDAVAYDDTVVNFAQMSGAALGLEAGHWQQVVTTDAQRTERYYDGMWRLRLERTWDTGIGGGSLKVVRRRWDHDGHKTFESYPLRDWEGVDHPSAGHTWAFDALGRETLHRQDSELGTLDTTTQYIANFRKTVTNPRGFATTHDFQAWDEPEESRISTIWAPENVTVQILRDAYGKAHTITRSGNGASVSRLYRYDGHQRLCKTIEPESGATVQAYDGAGNLAWRASGQNLPGSGCDQGAVPEASKASFSYDTRNRLKVTSYGDGSPGITRDYTADGLLAQISTFGGSNAIGWTYTYNNRRLLTQERYTWGDPNNGWSFHWGINAQGHVSSLSDLWGTLQYAPNALGEPTQVSGYASGVTYHPNGAVAGYTLANGVVHSTTLNLRGLPLRMRNAGITQDLHAYDANGNITAITDEQEGVNTRTMPWYDGLDRLRQVTGRWENSSTVSTASYAYDALDNLTSSTVGGRSLSHNINAATNRLDSLSGSQNISIGYDPNGNITQRGGQSFLFDIGNRMKSAPGKVDSYLYDGHGRRNIAVFAGNVAYMHQAYTIDGKLRIGWHSAEGATRHVYLGDKLIAETTDWGVTTFAHTDALGSPAAKTNAAGGLVSRTRYEPYGATVAGSTNPTKIGFTGHVNDVDTGLVYMQQRYYDPIAGRFLSVDPVTTNAKTGDFFGRYHYAYNNPYTFVDPDGREATIGTCGWAIALCGVSGGGSSSGSSPEENSPFSSGSGADRIVGATLKFAVYTAVPGLECGQKGCGKIGWFVAVLSALPPMKLLGPAAKGAGPLVGGGAKLENLTAQEIARIQNAANRTGTPISVVGSRANGTARATSDWDYVVPEATRNRTVHSLRSSLPEGHRGLGQPRNQDFFKSTVDPSKPFITFTPQ